MQLQKKLCTLGYQLQVVNTLTTFDIQNTIYVHYLIIITLKIKLKVQMITDKTRDQIFP